mgnify:FL=1
MFWDQHMHCNFSGDSDALPEDMIKAGIAHGLSGICFTDHLDYDYPEEPNIFLLDFDNYFKVLSDLREKYADKISVNIGIELGLQPQAAGQNLAVAEKYPFDFIIGSSHVVNHMDPYYPEFFAGRDEDAAYMEYFESVLENINSDVDFDVYGHIDYVVRYGPNKNAFYTYEKFKDIIDEILTQLISKGKGIEVNTGGFKHGLGHPNPTEDIIKRYHELGGEIITMGADAHVPEYVAYEFDKTAHIIKKCGFKYYTVFKNRKAEFIPL